MSGPAAGPGIALLENPIQEYAWGSRTAIASLLGEEVPSQRPQAELWMGAHPVAPSHVASAGRPSLCDAIRSDPVAVLGTRVARDFGRELPFLLKVLAVEQPLSLAAGGVTLFGVWLTTLSRAPRVIPTRQAREATTT